MNFNLLPNIHKGKRQNSSGSRKNKLILPLRKSNSSSFKKQLYTKIIKKKIINNVYLSLLETFNNRNLPDFNTFIKETELEHKKKQEETILIKKKEHLNILEDMKKKHHEEKTQILSNQRIALINMEKQIIGEKNKMEREVRSNTSVYGSYTNSNLKLRMKKIRSIYENRIKKKYMKDTKALIERHNQMLKDNISTCKKEMKNIIEKSNNVSNLSIEKIRNHCKNLNEYQISIFKEKTNNQLLHLQKLKSFINIEISKYNENIKIDKLKSKLKQNVILDREMLLFKQKKYTAQSLKINKNINFEKEFLQVCTQHKDNLKKKIEKTNSICNKINGEIHTQRKKLDLLKKNIKLTQIEEKNLLATEKEIEKLEERGRIYIIKRNLEIKRQKKIVSNQKELEKEKKEQHDTIKRKLEIEGQKKLLKIEKELGKEENKKLDRIILEVRERRQKEIFETQEKLREEEEELNRIIQDTDIIKKNINFHRGDFTVATTIISKKILINVHSDLNSNAGDTIMVLNYMNLFMKNNNHITLITKYKCPEFIRNLIYKTFTIVISGDNKENIMNTIDKYMSSVDYALIRNHEVLEEMKSKPYLNRVIFYGLDCHMDGLKKMNNEFHYIITQSELLKKKLVKNNIDSEKIYIVQPIVFKYDFNLPKKNDNEIRLVYCGTLRDEENILEIIEEFQKIHKKRPEVVLKIVYGKIHGDVTFTRKVNEYIKNGVKGITFKHNLSHKDACYEIATSDIGICWRKNGWGDNGEISTKVKEYQMFGLDIINDLKIKVGVVTSTNKTNKIENIIRNYKRQIYFNKKLFLIINNNLIKIERVKQTLIDNKLNFELIFIEENYNLGYCLNKAIEKMKEQKYDIFAKFDDDDSYEKKYLLEQIYYLNKYQNCIVGKYNIPLFIPEHNNFYTIDNFTKTNQFAEICRGSTIMFNINNVNHRFCNKKRQGVDSIFLKHHRSNGDKIYVTSFDNYIWIRYLDKNKHTWNLDINDLPLKQIIDPNLIYKLYSSLLEYTFINVSHLLVTVIVTMYNSSKTIEQCLYSMLNQTHKNIEIIVVDDESDDNSIELVEKFMKNNNKIRLIKNKENRGTYYCKNLALQSMNKNTKYIAFQDSDDYSHQERIRKQIEILYLTNAKLSVTLCERYNVLRFACISQVYDIEIFNKLGYFDNSRFGADSEYLYRFFKLNNIKLIGSYKYNKGSIFNNNFGVNYCIPYKLYNINNNDDTCLSNLNPLNSKQRLKYKTNYINKINKLYNLYYDFN